MNNAKKYTLISNIAYALKKIWIWDKLFYFYSIPAIPISILLSFATIYFPKIIIDSVETNNTIISIIITITVYFGILLSLNFINRYCLTRLNMRRYNYSTLYQHEIIEKFMSTDFSNTDNPKLNIKYSHAMNDAVSGQCAPEFIWKALFQFLITFIGVFTYATIIATTSSLILILLILSAIITYFVNRGIRNYSENNKDKWAIIDRKIDYISGFSSKFEYAKDIRIYGMVGWLNELLMGFQADRFNWTKKVSLRKFLGSLIAALLTLLRDSVAYIILISMLFENKISVGDFVFYFGAITGLATWLNGISGQINDIIEKSYKISYYRDYFDMDEKYNHGEGYCLPSKAEWPVEVEFKQVSYKYSSSDEEKYALKNINLKIHKGEKLAIVGENGAGKTTIIKLLCGLYYPSSGEITLNGIPIESYNIKDYYTLFSVVFQDLYLLPVTIAEFISSCDSDIDWNRIDTVIQQAGLKNKIDSLCNGVNSHLMKGIFEDSIELSGGEKQKLMLARALYKDAPMIILDEPTAALDPIAEDELYKKYSELTKNKTSVYISHRLASTRFCDRIIYIHNGEIIEEGTHDELMKYGGKYAYMFELQSHYYKEVIEDV